MTLSLRHLLGALFCGVGLVTPTQFASAEMLDLFIHAGQSNSVGSGDQRDLPEGYPETDDSILYKQNTDFGVEDWGPLKPRNITSEVTRWFGPEFSFGHSLTAAGVNNVAMIKYARNGTNLFDSWAPDTALRNSFYAYVDEAIAELQAMGHTYRLAGFIWVHGSGDAGTLEKAEAYDENLTQFVGEIEARYGETTTIINRYHIDSNRGSVDAIRISQGEFGAASPDNFLVHTDDLALKSDFIHFVTPTFLEVGDRLAERYLQSLLPAGDYTGDGVVDAADYSAWRDSLGSISELDADGNGNGVIDQADYDVWRQGFLTFNASGDSQANANSTPEPSSCCVLIWLTACSCLNRRPQ